MQSKIIDLILALLVTLIVAVPMFFLFFFIAMKVFPPEHNDRTVMPTEQVAVSIALTLLSGTLIFRNVLNIIRKTGRKLK